MDTAECVTEIEQVLDMSDLHVTAGWAYWQFKNYGDFTTSASGKSQGFWNFDGSLQTNKIRALARPYVMAA